MKSKQKPGKNFRFNCGHRGKLPATKGEHNAFAIWNARDNRSPSWGCRKCTMKGAKKWRKANPKNCVHYRAKQNAQIQGVTFSLRISDIPDMPKTCPVFPWIKLVCGTGLGKGVRNPNTASLDRIDPDKGYVPGNIRIISFRANMLKNNASLKELRALVKDMNKIARSR